MTMFRHGGALRGLGGRNYVKRIGAIFGSSIVAFWPQSEASGSIAYDISGNSRHGAYNGVTLGAAGIGNTAASFDGTTSFNNIYSAGLAGAFNGAAGTYLLWLKVSGAGVWSDAASREALEIQADASNRVIFFKGSTANQINWRYTAGGTAKSIASTSYAETGWQCFALTWSKAADAVIPYALGLQVGATQTGLGTWAGSLNSSLCCIGAHDTGPTAVWSGSIGPVLLLNRAATAAEILAASTL